MDRVLAVVELLEADSVDRKHIVHVEGPQVPRPELLPRRCQLPIGIDVILEELEECLAGLSLAILVLSCAYSYH